MYYQNDYIAKNIRTQQVNEYLREVELDRLIARLDSQRPNRIPQLARGIGHLLLATGHAIGRLHSATRRPLHQIKVPEAQIRIRRWS